MQLIVGNAALLFFLIVPVLLATASIHVLHEKRDLPLEGAIDRQRIEKHALLPMRIGLRQNQHAELNAEKWLMDVSDPLSPNYGRHWSQEEVIEAFKPSEDTLRNVTAWLHSYGIHDFTHTDNKMWFAFDAPVAKAEFMLQTQYFEHENEHGGFEASCDFYHLPADLQPHIHFVTPGVKSSDVGGRTIRSRASPQRRGTRQPVPVGKRAIIPDPAPKYTSATSLEHCASEVTPACVRALYNFSIPDQTLPVSPNNSMGIFAWQDVYWQGDLDLLYHYFAPHIPDGTGPIYAPMDDAVYPPNVTHGATWDLIQYEAELDLQCSIPIIYPQTTTLFEVGSPFRRDIFAVPMSWNNYYNRFLSAIDGSYCSEAQRGNSSNGGRPQCGIYKPTNVISFSYGYPEHVFPNHWKERQCNEYLKLGLQGTSIFFCTQDWGVGALGILNYNIGSRCNGSANGGGGPRVFMPPFPAGCPYVTSVGATEIRPDHTVYDPENSAQWTYYYHGKHHWYLGPTGGGGFSLTFNRPGYQDNAVTSYYENHNPRWPYFYNGHWQNSTGRYIGKHLTTFYKNGYEGGAGTSASTPIVAALFNRIVEERLRIGKGPLGFVNPTLYKHPEALNDVVNGMNGYCTKEDGFEAAPGWDPVAGLGTPDYGKLLDIFMNLP